MLAHFFRLRGDARGSRALPLRDGGPPRAAYHPALTGPRASNRPAPGPAAPALLPIRALPLTALRLRQAIGEERRHRRRLRPSFPSAALPRRADRLVPVRDSPAPAQRFPVPRLRLHRRARDEFFRG